MFPGYYTEQNVVLSATHTHSGPAGYMQYVLFNVSNLGFLRQSLDALVDGIVDSIYRAHRMMVPAKIYLSTGTVEEANINRSPTSYEANPEEEKAKYNSNTDKTMVQLTFVDIEEDEKMGVLNWFAVHPTSMNNTNHLISGDNKGAASQMFEKAMNTEIQTGKGRFTAAFASTNLGDVSPNIMGPKCLDTGLPCDLEHSTCDGRTQMCVAFGPGEDIFESTKIIAERQYAVSKALFDDEEGYQEVTGSVKFIHQWIDMTNYPVKLDNGSMATTCKAALGYSFAAGTTDGPGEFDFTQGVTTGNPFWDFISGILKDPEPETEACHAPKPILLDTGEFKYPYAWHPTQVDTQILKIGQMFLLAVPGEFTTMAGRRLRESVRNLVGSMGEPIVPVVAGLSNTYTHYITTFEEYQKQRYEAASTIYGPHSLRAYQQQYTMMAEAMLNGQELPAGTPPEDLLDVQLSFIPGIIFDNSPGGLDFGSCIQQPHDANQGDFVTAKFISGHLRNDLMTDDTFLRVERNENGEWIEVAVDDDWSTRLYWERTNVILGESEVTVIWEIPEDALNGEYRIIHKGYYKSIIRGLTPYLGVSKTFLVGLSDVKGLFHY
eukprot:TRINITY_DN21220_c0_g1_i4.p1 TRINITY_DN21220_c0_g1~~TRINITY_DN21220_c0_g1_i4.p1  ORF type:complete len:687 (+),score=151.03 TRINITY_DN21220_c0_g1_i4:252-2063(+)